MEFRRTTTLIIKMIVWRNLPTLMILIQAPIAAKVLLFYTDINHGNSPDLENVMANLHKKYSIVNFLHLKQILFDIHVTPPSLPCSPSLPPLPLTVPLSISYLDSLLARAHSLTTAGKLTSALEQYRSNMLARQGQEGQAHPHVC